METETAQSVGEAAQLGGSKGPTEEELALAEQEECELEGRPSTIGGRKPKRLKHAIYLKSMRDVVTLDEWNAVVKYALKQAKRGNHNARKWLSDYLLGPPVRQIAPPRADEEAGYDLNAAKFRFISVITRIIEHRTAEGAIEGDQAIARRDVSTTAIRLDVLGTAQPTTSGGPVDDLVDAGG